tara:strand:- start:754 stop:1149 length:396 start_codon:yes stop_codon:yes gene_type:complete
MQVLIVDDNLADAQLIEHFLNEKDVSIESVVFDGGQVFLDHLDSCDDSDLPDLVVLDLEMPGIDGIEVLKSMRAEERTATIPVVVYSGNVDENKMKMTYRYCANSYVVKSLEGAKQIAEYWTETNHVIRRK